MAAPTVTADDRPAPEPRPVRRRGRVLLRVGTAATAGLLLYTCVPPRSCGGRAPVALAAVPTRSSTRPRLRTGRGSGAGRSSAAARRSHANQPTVPWSSRRQRDRMAGLGPDVVQSP